MAVETRCGHTSVVIFVSRENETLVHVNAFLPSIPTTTKLIGSAPFSPAYASCLDTAARATGNRGIYSTSSLAYLALYFD